MATTAPTLADSAGEQADRAVENITRLQLGPAEPGGIALDATLSASAGCYGA